MFGVFDEKGKRIKEKTHRHRQHTRGKEGLGQVEEGIWGINKW